MEKSDLSTGDPTMILRSGMLLSPVCPESTPGMRAACWAMDLCCGSWGHSSFSTTVFPRPLLY